MIPHYAPGAWFGLVTDGGMALLPGGIDDGVRERIWESMQAGQGLGALLEALTGAFGTSLSALPSFAIVTLVGDEARIAVRGPITATVQETERPGTVRVSGARVTTWSESVVEHPLSIDLAADAAAPGPRQLPIGSGIVLCDALRLVLRALPEPEPLPTDTLDPGVEPRPAPGESLQAVSVSEPDPGPAVAIIPEPEPEPEAEPALAPESRPAPEPSPVPAPEPVPEPTVEVVAVPDTEPAEVPEAHPATDTISVTEHTMGLAYDGLWGNPTEPVVVPETPLIAALPVFASADTLRDDLVGRTAPEPDSDHDGETISLEELRALGLAGPATAVVPGATGLLAPVVPGRLRISIGGEVVLDRGAIIGRKPSAARFSADRMPHLITVPSPKQDISRSHVEVRCEGMHVFAIDLATTNGTRLCRVGKEPERLHPQEPAMLVDGDVLDLGDGITVTYLEQR